MSKDKLHTEQTVVRSYEDNPDDKEALQKAIEKLPVKDYSEYEIAIESKEYYEDALFQDEESLLKATTENVNTPTLGDGDPVSSDDAASDNELAYAGVNQESTHSGSTPTKHPTKSNPQPLVEKNYQRFISTNIPQQHLGIDRSAREPIALCSAGINQSPPNFSYLCETIIDEPIMAATERGLDTASADSSANSQFAKEKNQSTAGSFFKKIQTKATDTLNQRKEKVDEYLGRTLPARELALDFQTPKLKPAKEFEGLYSDQKMAELLQAKKIKNLILSRCEQALAKVLKSDLSNHKKANILAVTEQPIAERSRSLINSLERKPCLTEDPDRAEAVYLCLQTIRQLINGYKQLYSQLYDASNLIYGPQRDKANQHAFKLVDLLCLEQRLCIASHHNTAEANLRTFNNIYLGLALYEPEQLVVTNNTFCLGAEATIQSLFINYQLLSALQTQQLSARFHKHLMAYIVEHQASLNILPLNHNQRLEQPTWCIEHNHASTAVLVKHLRVKSEGDFPCLYIQLQGFLSAVKKDYLNVLKQLSGQTPSQALSGSLDTLNPREKLIVLSMLNDSVNRIEASTHPAQFSRYQPESTQVYSSMNDAISLLRFESYQLQTIKTKTDDKPEKPPAAKSNWSVAHEDQHSIYLQTDELKSKLSLDIGHVLLFSKTIADDNEQTTTDFRIGHIASLNREHCGKILIHLQKYGEDTAAIKIQSKQNTIDAIISDAGDTKYLLLEKAPYLKTGTVLAIEFDNGLKTTITIVQLITVTPQCYVYRLH